MIKTILDFLFVFVYYMSYNLYYNVLQMAVSNEIMSVRLPSKLKKDAMQVADDLWVSLSTVIQAYLKKFIHDKYITIWYPFHDENHIAHYKTNPEYVEVNATAEDVVSFLHASINK